MDSIPGGIIQQYILAKRSLVGELKRKYDDAKKKYEDAKKEHEDANKEHDDATVRDRSVGADRSLKEAKSNLKRAKAKLSGIECFLETESNDFRTLTAFWEGAAKRRLKGSTQRTPSIECCLDSESVAFCDDFTQRKHVKDDCGWEAVKSITPGHLLDFAANGVFSHRNMPGPLSKETLGRYCAWWFCENYHVLREISVLERMCREHLPRYLAAVF